MELVYLWVEEYKNIHRQGFNFSPRFRCEFDGETLTIDDNLDHIENFFGDNINVTAIVGKNGSGKSSLLDIVSELKKDTPGLLLYINDTDEIVCDHTLTSNPLVNRDIIFNNHPIDGFFAKEHWVFGKKRIGSYYLQNASFGEKLYQNISHLDMEEKYNIHSKNLFVPKYVNAFLEYRNLFEKLAPMYFFDTLRLEFKNNSTTYLKRLIKDELHRTTYSYNDDYTCAPEDNETTRHDAMIRYFEDGIKKSIQDIEIRTHDKYRKEIVLMVEQIESIHRAQNFYTMPSIHDMNRNKFSEFSLSILIAFIEFYLKNTNPCSSSAKFLYEIIVNLESDMVESINKNNDNEKIRISYEYILDFFDKLLEEENSVTFNNDTDIDLNDIVEAVRYVAQYTTQNKPQPENPFPRLFLDIKIDEELDEVSLNKIKILQKVFADDDEVMAGEEKYLRVFEPNLYNSKKGIIYQEISDGEKHFIQVIIGIISGIKSYRGNQSLLLLADEPDNALHPIWKKQLLSHTLNVLNAISLNKENNNVHFVFTTHSPFLLSDIPKQNIIFLDTYKEKDKEVEKGNQEVGNCKVLKHDEVLQKKETFGANIHTLLSDSFFMSDGLMGEFAKSRIQEIMDYLNDKKIIEEISTKEEQIKQVIESIGEPFLRQKLLDMYYTKYKDESVKEARKKELLAQQRQINEELKRL